MTHLIPIIAFCIALAAANVAGAGGTAQVEGRSHAGPKAYHAMCTREPALCAGDRAAGRKAGTGPVARLTTKAMRTLRRVNDHVNAQIQSTHDHTVYGVSDFWTSGRRQGDCEDYMITKKQSLIAAGFAPDQLLYAVVRGTESPYHAVLIVRTDMGDLVLDNLRSEILDWRASNYRFVVRQSAANPQQWVRVGTVGARIAARDE